MVKIESLKDYIGKISREEFLKLATKIYIITDSIRTDYSQYKEWYFQKQLPAITSDKRNILFIRNSENPDEIIAMACLKKESNEQKICTLYVSNKYRGLGVGTKIIEESMKWLGTTSPLVTLADYKLDMFIPIIKKYNWQLTEVVEGLYNNRCKELCFNGSLSKQNNREKDLHKRLVKSLKCRKQQLKNNNNQ